METQKDKICIIMTGGTICSVPDAQGKNYSDAKTTNTRLTEYYFKKTNSPFKDSVKFDIKALAPDILSENMTANTWGDLLKIFRDEVIFDDYKGIIVLHGTDTLAYTSAFLSYALAGIKIPVCMVSAQQRLGEIDEKGEWHPNPKTNGYANFRAAVELIMNSIAPNVYVVYKNESKFLVHYGEHLRQCANFSNDFHSCDEMPILDVNNAKLAGKKAQSEACLYKYVSEITKGVLLLQPYTNLNYASVNLEGVKAVVHGTYHSESVCIGRANEKCRASGKAQEDYELSDIVNEDRPYSILYLLEECDKRGIPVILAPCDKETAMYGTTANACKRGAIPVGRSDVTLEATYAKTVLRYSLENEIFY